MNYEHLRYLLKIKEVGSISGAAEHCFISQPHLSNVIQAFEKKLGFKIFFRSHVGVVPTAEAEGFFRQIEEVLMHIDEFEEYFTFSSEEVYRLKIATVPYCFVEQAIRRLMLKQNKKYIDICLEHLNPFILPKEIMNGHFEIGFLSYNTFFEKYIKDPVLLNQTAYVEMARFTPKLLISKRHPAYDILSKDFTKLENYTMVCNTMFEDTVMSSRDAFRKTSIRIPRKNYIVTNDAFSINYYVASGAAYAISLHEEVYPNWMAANRIEQIPLYELENSISMGYLHKTNNELTPYIVSLIDCWKAILKEKHITEL